MKEWTLRTREATDAEWHRPGMEPTAWRCPAILKREAGAEERKDPGSRHGRITVADPRAQIWGLRTIQVAAQGVCGL